MKLSLSPIKAIVYAAALLSPLLFFSFSNDPDSLETILKKLQIYHTDRPQEKLYVHFDKPFYAAGETVWFKAYLVEATYHHLDSLSRVAYVELIDTAKAILQRKMLYLDHGVGFGDFKLPDNLPPGNYLMRAYTNYMKNAGEDFFFHKELSILSSAVDQSPSDNIKFNPESNDLQFFPEGGNLVACGTFNRIAFKATGPDGKSLEIEGEIVDETNSVVSPFQTEHNGMGILRLNPAKGKTYRARITKPYSVTRLFPLPRVNNTGYILQVDEIGKNIKVVIFSNAEKPASGKLDFSIVVQSRGNVYHAQRGTITSNAFFTYIPTAKLPDGISQITLFDAEGRPVAERLVHQNQRESISITLHTDTLVYGQRSLVTVYTDALYRNGSPAKGNFSVTVYDEGLLKAPEKYPLSITNYLSLTSDLKGYIENPGYYFKDSLPETKKRLDLLMMVNGWRRFTWQDVLTHNGDPQKHVREQGIPVSGRILKPGGKKAPEESNLKIMTMTGNAVVVKPDSLGRFYSDGLLYYDSMDLVIQTENEKGKKQPYKFLLDPFNPSPPSEYTLTAFTPFDASPYLKQQSEANTTYKTSEVTVLEEVKIVGKKEHDTRLIGLPGDAIDVKELGSGNGYTNIFQMLQTRVAGLVISGNPPNMSVLVRGKEPALLMNGMNSSLDFINMISPSDVETIEVLRNGGALYGAATVINVVLKSGAWAKTPTIGVSQAKYPGFYQAREFYSPRYDVPDDRHNLPDKRTTLYWEPLVETDHTGKVAFAFYTADVSSRYRIIIEGITTDGYPGTSSLSFDVK